MSKVQLQGNVSGTGIFTIASPNSNTDRTLTLPNETGTLLTSGGAISGTTGTFTGLLNISAATAGQIQFPATANLSSNANTLDDYEEGTWNATPSTSNSSLTPLSGFTTINSGYYIKMGSFVWVSFYFGWSTTTSNTGILYLILPFPANAGGDMWSSTGCEQSEVTFPAGATYMTARPESSGSWLSFKGCGSAIGRYDLTFANIGGRNNGYVIGMAAYRTAA